MKKTKLLLFCLFFAFISSPLSAQTFADIVRERNFEEAGILAKKLLKAANMRLSTGIGERDSVEKGEKLAGRFIITDLMAEPLRMMGCVVFTAAPLKSGSYISHSLIVSTAPVESGSYITNSTIISTQGVKIGSYSSNNVIQAESVEVGSDSTNNRYYNVTPRTGKPGQNDKVTESTSFNDLLGF